MVVSIQHRIKANVQRLFNHLNSSFNGLPKDGKHLSILAFGICATGISATLVIQALRDQEKEIHFKPDRIAMPHDIFKDHEKSISDNQLIPVGKMKGEIDGKFESFYVAVDSEGSIYINRDIEYSARAYEKTEDWKQISREKLAEFDKHLHFIPSTSRGIKR